MDSLTTFRRTITVVALALAVGAVVVPSAVANGDDGDRATSKPIIVSSAPEGFGSLGDRATSKSMYGPVDTWYQYAVSAGKSVPVSATVPAARFVSSDGLQLDGLRDRGGGDARGIRAARRCRPGAQGGPLGSYAAQHVAEALLRRNGRLFNRAARSCVTTHNLVLTGPV